MIHPETVWDLEELVEHHEAELDRLRPLLNQAIRTLRREVLEALGTNDPLAESLARKYHIGQRRAA